MIILAFKQIKISVPSPNSSCNPLRLLYTHEMQLAKKIFSFFKGNRTTSLWRKRKKANFNWTSFWCSFASRVINRWWLVRSSTICLCVISRVLQLLLFSSFQWEKIYTQQKGTHTDCNISWELTRCSRWCYVLLVELLLTVDKKSPLLPIHWNHSTASLASFLISSKE